MWAVLAQNSGALWLPEQAVHCCLDRHTGHLQVSTSKLTPHKRFSASSSFCQVVQSGARNAGIVLKPRLGKTGIGHLEPHDFCTKVAR